MLHSAGILMIATGSMFMALNASAVAAPIDASQILVIEGDLIRIHRQPPDVRLLGFNAPEVLRAQCRKEKAFGESPRDS